MDPEEAAALLIHEYGRTAAGYDADAAPYNAPLVRRLLDLAALQPGGRVLDLGCGTGNLAFEAARLVGEGGHVVGIDLAEGMVALAIQKAAQEGWRNVEFEVMDCRELSHPQGAFDVVASCLGVPSVGFGRCFQESYRVLRKGGRLVYCVGTGAGPSAGILETFRKVFEKHRPPPSVDVLRLIDARRVLHATGEHEQLRKPELTAARLRSAGFEAVEHRAETFPTVFPTFDDYVRHRNAWGDNEREWSAMSDDVREAIRRELLEVAPRVRSEGISYQRDVLFTCALKGS